MTRDYKNISEANTKGKKTARKSRKSEQPKGLPVWFWLVSGVVIGTFVSFLVYLKLNVNVENEANITHKSEKSIVSEPLEQKPKQLKEEKSRFEFYSILPQRNIDVSVDAPADSTVKVEETKKDVLKKEVTSNKAIHQSAPAHEKPARKKYENRLYVLQVGSFSHFKDADKRKANLAFIGVISKIHAISREKKTMYRVQVGPYTSLAKINEIASTLKQNKIRSLLMKVKG